MDAVTTILFLLLRKRFEKGQWLWVYVSPGQGVPAWTEALRPLGPISILALALAHSPGLPGYQFLSQEGSRLSLPTSPSS